MKFGFLVVIALIVSAFAAHILLQDPGYVVINFRGYLVEMSVPVLAGLIVAALGSMWLIVKLLRAPRKLGQAAGRYRSGRAGQRLTQGMIEIAEGNFAKGERMLARAAGASDAPLLNYLQAARAAHLLGHDERRDNWLKQAYEGMPEAANAVLLTQAEFQLDQGQYEQALATLRRIEESAPNHAHALTLLGRIYYRLEDWRHLGELLPRLRKYGRADAATLEKWSLRVLTEEIGRAQDGDGVNATWASAPKSLRKDGALTEAYYTALLRVGAHAQAEKELTARLRRGWDGGLVRIYGMIDSGNPAKHLRQAEKWLTVHPNDPDLLLSAARLCLRNELWGKARSYFETVIGLRPTPEIYQEYGRLLNRLGESDAAAEAYKTGLGMVSGKPLPAIPHLKSDRPIRRSALGSQG